ncbi:MAG: tripartite tricarboxylate transporter substrate binding protein [Firmicutes bacterium]|jgi:tripartite-type tricarboxylate transporter receptor subunit TctC|nr:tripartite tricarboxylate transporter substrate binding protein [Bacillota bacterium]MDH7495224.1 tripartite tricarboxylate transporter substrate binding protein [Bacillota bacterium]
MASKAIRRIVLASVTMMVLASLAGAGVLAAANGDLSFFKGKVIKFIVPYSVGGGFDSYARAMAPYLEEYIPGVTVVVQNVAGGGGMIGINTLYAADPDGLTIGIAHGAGAVINQVLKTPGTRFNLEEMNWLARVTTEPLLTVVSGKSPFKTVKDFAGAGRPIVFAQTGVGSGDYYGSLLLLKALGINYKVVTGFPGSREANLAVVRGEGVDGTSAFYGSLVSLIETGDVRPVVQLAFERHKDLPGVPTALEVVPPENRELARALTSLFEIKYIIAAPPKVPAERVSALRAAFDKVFADQEFIDWSVKMKCPVDYLNGAALDKLVRENVDAFTKLERELKAITEKG